MDRVAGAVPTAVERASDQIGSMLVDVDQHQLLEQPPVSVEQVAAAMVALGMYDGANTQAEHVVEAGRLGGEQASP
ncbi:MAG: hypothetical protein DLM59_11540 [Pseudonocardiales bacterium]|nr:MAG: hypothetical protein DLM59_11540 [Pseudonocardiales bacterium]